MTGRGAVTGGRERGSALAALKRVDGVWGLLLVLLVVGVIVRPQFLTPGNLGPVMLSTAPLVLLAVGQAFVLIGREIDLSVGSTVGLAGVVCGALMNDDPAMIVPITLLALLVGGLVGAVNGVLTAVVGVPSFIVTLGMLLVVRGLIYVGTGGAPKSDIPNEYTRWLLGTQILGFATGPLIVLIVACLIAWYLGARSWSGRRLYLTGSSPEAARLAGLPARRAVVSAFVVNGVFAAAAGVYYAVWQGSVRGDQGTGMELLAIAAAVLGGVSLLGGRGRYSGAVAGALALGLIFNILILAGLPLQAQNVGKGLIIIAAALVYERFRNGRRRRRSRTGGEPPTPTALIAIDAASTPETPR